MTGDAGVVERAAVLAWFAARARDLPWRRSRDPWGVLVSEVMLQQTQVARVVDRWPRFLARFPDPDRCAAAPLAAVIEEWEGLGYNRRAVNLHRAASVVVDECGGTLPDDLDGLLALPGVGPYTARAVLAFAFERDVGVVDTNVGRVLARAHGRALTATEAQSAADAVVPTGRGWEWNQAVLDLGAGVCTARDPSCEACPVAPSCAWWGAGRPDPDPALGSAGVAGGQSRFEGSDRQGRGRLVDALRRGEVAAGDLAAVMGWSDDPDRAHRVARTLVADGLATVAADGSFRLPT